MTTWACLVVVNQLSSALGRQSINFLRLRGPFVRELGVDPVPLCSTGKVYPKTAPDIDEVHHQV